MNRDPSATVAVDANGVLRLSGHIGYCNADQMLPIGREAMADGSVTQIDLSGLKASDSATLAVLLVWAEEAARKKQQLVMRDPPDGLRALVRLCHAEALLKFA